MRRFSLNVKSKNKGEHFPSISLFNQEQNKNERTFSFNQEQKNKKMRENSPSLTKNRNTKNARKFSLLRQEQKNKRTGDLRTEEKEDILPL